MPNFITKIKIKNFFSIKNEIEIDFSANDYTIKNHKDRVFEYNGKFYNKLISFYGANATGKTTILKALVVVGAIINNDNKSRIPFSIKNKYAHPKSKTEITINFVINSQEFQYVLVLDYNETKINNKISNEMLYLINENRKTTFFNRRERKLNIEMDKSTKTILFENLSNTVSIIKEFEIFDKSNVLPMIKNFLGSIPYLSNIKSAFFTHFGVKEEDEERLMLDIMSNENLKLFLIKFLRSIGMDIKDVDVEFKLNDDKQIIGLKNILIYHEIDTKIPLEYKLESDGTKILFKLLIDMYLAKQKGSILVVDELDSVLHAMLVPLLCKLAIDNDIQLLYTTHNIYNMKFLYSDEIYIVEKDKDHDTNIIEPKKDENIKGYENFLIMYEENLLGGLPKFHNIFTEININE